MNNKTIVFSFIFSLLFILLIVSVIDARDKYIKHIKTSEVVTSLLFLNKDLDKIINNKIAYNNAILIETKMKELTKSFTYLTMNKFDNEIIKKEFFSLKKKCLEKINYIKKIKPLSILLNNSFVDLQNINEKSFLASNVLYKKFLQIQNNNNIDIERLFENINENDFNKGFLFYSKNFVKYYKEYELIEKQIETLEINLLMNSFSISYNLYLKNIVTTIFFTLILAIICLSIFVIIFIIYSNKIIKKENELHKFQEAVYYSDNIIYITDTNKRIKYVNKAFEESTNMLFKDIKDKKPSFLKSHSLKDNVYNDLNKTIYNGKVWNGEFINKNKKSKIRYEKVSISPIFDKEGKITEFLTIKLDITKEKIAQKKREKEKDILSQQSKMLAIGEMLESISHQWKQPLSAISTAASGLKLKQEYNSLDEEEIINFSNLIISRTSYLSGILNNFSDVFKNESYKTLFNMTDTINKVLELLECRLNKSNIVLVKDLYDIEYSGYESELMQVFLSLLNNALDVLENVKDDRYIFINLQIKEDSIEIVIKDNGHGVKEGMQNSIFEPYFTTKHKSQGTGLGLYMSYDIIFKHFNGNIVMNNSSYEYNTKYYKGAEFLITIPLSS